MVGVGSPCDALVESDPVLMPGITTTTGQRAVVMEDHKPTPIKCLTLTRAPCAPRWRVKLHKDDGKECDRDARNAWQQSMLLSNRNRQTLKVKEDVIRAGYIFSEYVRSALPYIETVTQTRSGYEGVLIDKERILGLEVRLLPFVSPCI